MYCEGSGEHEWAYQGEKHQVSIRKPSESIKQSHLAKKGDICEEVMDRTMGQLLHWTGHEVSPVKPQVLQCDKSMLGESVEGTYLGRFQSLGKASKKKGKN